MYYIMDTGSPHQIGPCIKFFVGHKKNFQKYKTLQAKQMSYTHYYEISKKLTVNPLLEIIKLPNILL